MIATGTALVIGAGIAALAGTSKGIQDSRANSRATKAQTKANDDALAFERERAAVTDKRYDTREAAYQRDLAEWKARHGYGGGTGAQTPTNMSPVAVNARAAVMQQPGVQATPGSLGPTVPGAGAASRGLTLRDIASGAMPPMPAEATVAAGAVQPQEVSSMQPPLPQMGQPRTLRDIAQWNRWA